MKNRVHFFCIDRTSDFFSFLRSSPILSPSTPMALPPLPSLPIPVRRQSWPLSLAVKEHSVIDSTNIPPSAPFIAITNNSYTSTHLHLHLHLHPPPPPQQASKTRRRHPIISHLLGCALSCARTKAQILTFALLSRLAQLVLNLLFLVYNIQVDVGASPFCCRVTRIVVDFPAGMIPEMEARRERLIVLTVEKMVAALWPLAVAVPLTLALMDPENALRISRSIVGMVWRRWKRRPGIAENNGQQQIGK